MDTWPCGKREYAAIGLTAKDRHLHALTSAASPRRPLLMFEWEWQALLKGPGPHIVTTVRCGDHGVEEYGDAVVSADHGRIYVKDRRFACLGNGSRGNQYTVTFGSSAYATRLKNSSPTKTCMCISGNRAIIRAIAVHEFPGASSRKLEYRFPVRSGGMAPWR